jgi:hypothetical protein
VGKIWGASHPDQQIAFGFNERKQNNMFALFEQDHLGTWSTKFKESKPYGWSKTSQLVAVWWLHVFVHLVWPNFDWHVDMGIESNIVWLTIFLTMRETCSRIDANCKFARRNVSWGSVPKLRCWT